MPESEHPSRSPRVSRSGSVYWHRPIDLLIDGVMTTLLIFAPLALGGTSDWSRLVILSLAWFMGCLFFVRQILRRQERAIFTGVHVVIWLYLLLLVIQIAPLPARLIELASPKTGWVRTVGFVPGDGAPNLSISLAPYYTWQALRMTIAYAVVFTVTLNVYREAWQVRKILGTIAIVGGIVAAIALIQRMLGLHSPLGIFENEQANQVIASGTFSNRNNFGVQLLLALGASLALLGNLYSKAARAYHIKSLFQYRRMPGADRQVLLAYLVNSIILLIAVIQTESRGALLALVISALIVGAIAANHFKGRDVFGAVIFGVILVMSIALSLAGDLLVPRFLELTDVATPQMRVQIAMDLWRMTLKFPLLGIGQGAMGTVYPMFQKLNTPLVAAHADNDFVEQLVETGLLGFVLTMLLILVVGRALRDSFRLLRGSVKFITYGLLFGLLAGITASATTWGMHVPANAIVVAAFAAVAIRLSKGGIEDATTASAPIGKAAPDGDTGRSGASGRVLPLASWVMLLGLIGTGYWMLPDAVNASAAESHAHIADLLDVGISRALPGSLDDFKLLITNREEALRLQPDRVDYRYELNYARWQSVVANVQLQARSQFNADERKLAYRIADDFHAARKLCPTHALSAAFEAQLRSIAGQERTGLALAGFVARTWPFVPHAQFVSGIVFADAGRIPESLACFRQAIAVDETLYRRRTADYFMNTRRPELAIAIALNAGTGDEDRADPDFAWWILARYRDDPAQVRMVKEADEKLEAILDKRVVTGATAEQHANLALLKARKLKFDQAAELYGLAIQRDYTRPEWHFSRAMALKELGRIKEAMEEVRSCIHLEPSRLDYRRALDDLSLMPIGGRQLPVAVPSDTQPLAAQPAKP